MDEIQDPPWPWWMGPARLVGRYRPALRAAIAGDAMALQGLPRSLVSIGLPLAVIALACFVSGLHAVTVNDNVSPQVNWLRFQIDDVWTEAPAFILLAIGIGVFSPALGAFLVLVFGITDLVAAAVQPYELRPLPGALAARLVAIWLLWLLIVEIPVLGRTLGASIRRFAGNRPLEAALNGLITGAFTLFWAAGAAILVRPIFVWTSLPSGGRVEAYLPMQGGGIVFAVAAGAIATAVAFYRRPGGLLQPGGRPPGSATEPTKHAASVRSAVRRVLFAAVLTIGLGGMITVPLDAVVLFAALAGAGPVARGLAARVPFGAVLDRLPSIARVAVAIPLVYSVSFLLIDADLLKSISEFFSVIAVFAVGLFVIELVTARDASGSDVRPPATAGASILGATLAMALVAITALAPMPVFADNGGSFVDMWPAIDIAVFAGMATPFIFWLAKRPPPPPPPPKNEPPPEGPPSPAEQKARDRMAEVLKRARDALRERKKFLGGGPPAVSSGGSHKG